MNPDDIKDLERRETLNLTDPSFKSTLSEFEGIDKLKIEEPQEKQETKPKVFNISIKKKKGLFKNL